MTLFVFQNAWVFCFVLFSILPRFFIALGVEVLRISLFSHCCKSFLPQRHFCLTSTVVRWLCRHQTLFSESFPKFFRECSAGPLQVWLPWYGLCVLFLQLLLPEWVWFSSGPRHTNSHNFFSVPWSHDSSRQSSLMQSQITAGSLPFPRGPHMVLKHGNMY